MKWIISIIARLFDRPRLVRGTGARIEGHGVVTHLDGTQTAFTMTGRPTLAALRHAHQKVFGRLAWLYPRQLGAVTHATAVRNAMADTVVDLLDGGTGAGYLEFQTSGAVEVATCPFSATAFGAASSGTATAATITDDSSATGGTISQFDANDGDDTTIFSGACGTSGSDINFSSLTIGAGDTVSVTSLTYSAPS